MIVVHGLTLPLILGIVERLGTKSTRLKVQENTTSQEKTYSEGLNQKTALEVISQITNHHHFLGIGHRVGAISRITFYN